MPTSAIPPIRDAVLSPEDRLFIEAHPVARLATAGLDNAPHVLPICFVVLESTLYLTIDQKPKSGDAMRLKRLRNITENSKAAVVVDRYDDDWSQLGWIMLRGAAEIIEAGPEHTAAQAALTTRYPPYRDMQLKHLPVVALRIDRITRWGNLSVAS